MDDFAILIERASRRRDLVSGKIYVNGKLIGDTYENATLMIPTGTYVGLLRYWSGRNFVAGPFGTIGKEGDFLLEVGRVENRTHILLHGGNKPSQSAGCILLGAVSRDPTTGIPALKDDHPLRLLRQQFYGTDRPTSTPNKQITIEIRDET